MKLQPTSVSAICVHVSREQFGKIKSTLDCFERPDLKSEVVLDCTDYESDDDRLMELSNIIGAENALEWQSQLVFICIA